MLSVDGHSRLLRSGMRQTGPEPKIVFDIPQWKFHVRKCESRSGRIRAHHELDRDSRCVFCDYLQPAK